MLWFYSIKKIICHGFNWLEMYLIYCVNAGLNFSAISIYIQHDKRFQRKFIARTAFPAEIYCKNCFPSGNVLQELFSQRKYVARTAYLIVFSGTLTGI